MESACPGFPLTGMTFSDCSQQLASTAAYVHPQHLEAACAEPHQYPAANDKFVYII